VNQTIIVTGGAGFIGANFVLAWVKLGLGRVINLDKLTYAGNLENLVEIQHDPNHIFVQGDIPAQSSILPQKAMLTVPYRGLVTLFKPMSLVLSICLNLYALIGTIWAKPNKRRSAFYMSLPMKYMAH
jgi:hypothetical protein